jgi:hypothetical protein
MVHLSIDIGVDKPAKLTLAVALEHFRSCRDQKSEDRIAKPFILLAFQPSRSGGDPV